MPKTVLVVEDYADTRAVMKHLLEAFGYRVLEAADGLEAIDRVRETCPNLVLMDISMPRMDGLTATAKIREQFDCSHVPIVAVTAFGKSYKDQAIAAGCNDLIDKPLDFENLEPIVKRYLG